MKCSKMLISVIFASLFSHAALAQQPNYATGKQKVSLQQNQECFVEITYSANNQQASVRGILFSSHENKNITVGPMILNAKVISGKQSFYFENKTPGVPVKQAVLWMAGAAPQQFQVAALHHDHYDNITCDGLQAPTAENLEEVEEAFEHFDEVGGNAGHNHNHNHKH